MTIAIRRCTAADSPALSLIGGATFLETYAGEMDGADLIAHCARAHSASYYDAWLAHTDGALWLAELDGAPIGFAGLSLPDFPLPDIGADDAELRRIYVLSRFHRLRLGTQLLDLALTEARARGKQRIFLGVKPDNTRALAFYTRMGFADVGRRKFYVGESVYDDFVLGRPL